MSETNPPSSAGGLRGQSAGSTAICTVGKSGVGLTYHGYAIEELAERATFEEVARFFATELGRGTASGIPPIDPLLLVQIHS